MPVSPARAVAFEVLLRVEQGDAYASELLHSSQNSRLSAVDHGLATELVMGVLRWQSLLDQSIAQQCLRPLARLDPEILLALRLGAYQLHFLERVPARAAINESVELAKSAHKRSASGFVNAVLRKLAARGKFPRAETSAACDAEELAAQTAHPLWMVERWTRNFGLELAHKICAGNQRVPGTAVCVAGPEVEDELKRDGIVLSPGRLLSSARIVERGNIFSTHAFLEGRVAIQDEASQLVALLVGRGAKILDCCAAPGGKTRILAKRNPDAMVVAVELHPHRARLLRKLVTARNVYVIAADIRDLPLLGQFDRVLVDAPCSGTGTLGRNPEIKWRLRPGDLADLQGRQLSILRVAMELVAPGGRLVYSTCSLEPEENSTVIDLALRGNALCRVVPCRGELEARYREGEIRDDNFDALTSGPYLRTLPGVNLCDGFFAAILERIISRENVNS